MIQDMRALVQEGYNKSEYETVFRITDTPNPFELRFLDSLCRLIPSNADILDLGSGPGIPYDKYFVSQGHNVVGVDFSERHLNLARKNVPKANYILGDFSKASFAEKSFNAVLSFYAIFHIPRREHPQLFVKMHKWLKPKGIILVTLGTTGGEYVEEKDWCGVRMAWSSYDPDTYKQIMNQTGFAVLEADFEGQPGDEEYHFWAMAQKG